MVKAGKDPPHPGYPTKRPGVSAAFCTWPESRGLAASLRPFRNPITLLNRSYEIGMAENVPW